MGKKEYRVTIEKIEEIDVEPSTIVEQIFHEKVSQAKIDALLDYLSIVTME